MTFTEGVQDVVLAAALVTFICGNLNRWAVANRKDKLASFTSAAGNAAGRILDDLSGVPAGADVQAMKAALLRKEAGNLMQEFDKSRPKGATEEKAIGIIAGQLGQLPGFAAIVPAVMPTPDAADGGKAVS